MLGFPRYLPRCRSTAAHIGDKNALVFGRIHGCLDALQSTGHWDMGNCFECMTGYAPAPTTSSKSTTGAGGRRAAPSAQSHHTRPTKAVAFNANPDEHPLNTSVRTSDSGRPIRGILGGGPFPPVPVPPTGPNTPNTSVASPLEGTGVSFTIEGEADTNTVEFDPLRGQVVTEQAPSQPSAPPPPPVVITTTTTTTTVRASAPPLPPPPSVTA